MKKYIILILAVISINSFGQTRNDYIEYYNLTNEGDKQAYFGNDSLAYALYLKAFKKVDYVHSDKLIKAAILAIKQKDYKNAHLFSKNAVIQGTEYKFYKKKEFKKFRKTDYYKSFIDSLDFYKKQFKKNLNEDYKYQLDSLYYVDQRIIRKNRTVKGNYNIDMSKLPGDLFELDSLIFVDVLALIEKYGFPTEKNVGRNTFNDVAIIYHHNFRLPQNKKYMPIAQEAVKKGAFLPRDYAWMYDQSLTWFGKAEPYFYYNTPFDPKTLEEKKELINKRRKEWGVKPLESEKTIIRGKSIITKHLW